MAGSRSVLLLLGSNLNNPLSQLKIARRLISNQLAKIKNASSIYKTSAWGNTRQPAFMNQVVEIISSRPPLKILEIVKNIERIMGRLVSVHWGPRIIDIDILFCGKEIIKTKSLTVPHKAMQDRMFTLIPLQELKPRLIHPQSKKSIQMMIASCTDQGQVKKIR